MNYVDFMIYVGPEISRFHDLNHKAIKVINVIFFVKSLNYLKEISQTLNFKTFGLGFGFWHTFVRKWKEWDFWKYKTWEHKTWKYKQKSIKY